MHAIHNFRLYLLQNRRHGNAVMVSGFRMFTLADGTRGVVITDLSCAKALQIRFVGCL